MKPFDLDQTPIEPGFTLIEASAGTGKTYTIAGLVARLVAERGVPIQNILVCTFTELATAELRRRIRARLREALVQQKNNTALEAALSDFDEAAIYTIHGFCQRVLQDRAFESGALFETELVTDQSLLLREIADDFWRAHFYDGPPVLTLVALKNKLDADKLLKRLELLVNTPTLRTVPETRPLAGVKAELAAAWDELGARWREGAQKIQGLFRDLKWMHPSKRSAVPGRLTALERCLAQSAGAADDLACLEKFTGAGLEKVTRAHQRTPEHEFFEACGRWVALEQEFVVAVQAEFFAWARDAMRARKLARSVFSFDDLLTNLRDALRAPGGKALGQRIRAQFQAALLDEFQDTDPVQYEIFAEVFGGHDVPVFFIGDPKQAIYGFRGADVYTYLRAVDATARRYTLDRNFRSHTDLVAAVNALFGQHPRPFFVERIPFHEVKASGRADAEAFSSQLSTHNSQPLQLWLSAEEKPKKVRVAREEITRIVAAEIARLLDGRATLGGKPVVPGHIAVLIGANRQAPTLQAALTAWNIPSAVYSAASVFKSREAAEIERILLAVAEPSNERRLRAALATDALGRTGEELAAWSEESSAWDEQLTAFAEAHVAWREKGFVQMLRALWLERGVRQRLLSRPNGERSLTNLLHLTELLHQACAENRFGMNGLLKWLRDQRAGGRGWNEADELRLERDEEAVRIITVHKSKGLEFEIVFCPFSWSVPEAREVYHDEETDRPTLDLVLPKQAWAQTTKTRCREETLAEGTRLLYVALTRAKQRCYFVWGNLPTNVKAKSGATYLLGGNTETELPTAARTAAEVRTEAERLAEESPHIAVEDLPAPAATVYRPPASQAAKLKARKFAGNIDRTWGITSFTALTTGELNVPEGPDHDSVEAGRDEEEPEIAEVPVAGIFAFPRGAAAGSCVHRVFETIDFTRPETVSWAVRERLREFNFRGQDEVLFEAVQRVLATELAPGVRLNAVPRTACLHELEFFVPIRAFSAPVLSRLLEAPLGFREVRGFLRGFIDLVFEQAGKFYFVDWKTNWLGPNAAAYGEAAMAAEMARKSYQLQLAIYALALHRFLRARQPGYRYAEHFGGAFYVFVRGADPANPATGIYRRRPPAEMIEELEALCDR